MVIRQYKAGFNLLKLHLRTHMDREDETPCCSTSTLDDG